MAHQRGHSTSDAKEPHSVSLKVLRQISSLPNLRLDSLSRPSLSIQHPLPTPTSSAEAPPVASSLAYPSSNSTDAFVLAPLLTLPQTFGSAYVGESFSCTLCANNELLSSLATPTKTINNVRIEAEMKIPSSIAPIPLVLGPDGDSTREEGKGLELSIAESLQRIVNFQLEEEGSHVLAVTVTYSETTPTSGRVRTFRKLYQFVCKGCMVIRTKTGTLPSSPVSENGQDSPMRWALEAQLENTGEETITLDTVEMETREGFKSMGLNWDMEEGKPVLMPGDVQQVCFLIEQDGSAGLQAAVDGKLIFGIMNLSWRGQMGNRGTLSTGTLGATIR